MPKISTELSPEEHATLTRWVRSAAVAAAIPGLDASQALHAMIKAMVTDTAAADVVLDLLRRGQGLPVQLITVTLDDKTGEALNRWLAKTAAATGPPRLTAEEAIPAMVRVCLGFTDISDLVASHIRAGRAAEN
jgi:hypothetical protein